MGKIRLIALLMMSVLCSLQPHGLSVWQEKAGAVKAPTSQGSIKVTIATGGGLYAAPKSQFKVGEDIPVVISMTNATDQPAKYCRSTSLFQDRPQLKRDGQLMPYDTNLTELTNSTEAIQRCEKSAARQFYELRPKQTRVVDWLKISVMGISWYGELPPGHYELMLMRRIDCCQGAMLESNKVAFEVVP